MWQWDGIQAQSLIFCKSDFSDPVEENILSICEEHIGEEFDDTKHTFNPSGDYVFFNYNLSINTKIKKLRVFDFDDTLVKTSSFIYITNGDKKTKLTPGQYAIYKEKPVMSLIILISKV